MSGVPYTFATATTSIPLSQLDANFATNATLGNATVGLGNTTTIVGNLTLQNPTITGVSSNITFASGTNGIVFNNNTSGELTASTLNDYETGTWTPTDQSGAGLTFSTAYGTYTKIGNTVYANGTVTYPVTASTAASLISLPFTSATSTSAGYQGGFIRYTTLSTAISVVVTQSSATCSFYAFGGTQQLNSNLSTRRIDFTAIYQANF